jgi:hypothetical protein
VRRRSLSAAGGALLLAAALTDACGSKASLVGEGAECFLATDCLPGLVCVEQSNKARVCSADLERVAGEPPSPGDGDDGGAADAAEGGAIAPDGAPDAREGPPPDAGPRDTGPPDAAAPPDTGPG